MSHQVTIDFEGISIQIQSQCEVASHSLCKIDKVLDRIHKTANKLETSNVKEYENYLLECKNTIEKRIKNFIFSLNKYKEMKSITIDYYYSESIQQLKNNIINQGNDLIKIVNELTGTKLAVIDEMINEELLKFGEHSAQKMMNKINGVLGLDKSILQNINEISDVSLRELAYRELVNDVNKSLSFNDIMVKANQKYESLLNKKTAHVIEEYKSELQSNGINTKLLDNISNIDEANKVKNNAIIDEKVRKETLKVIIKALKDRGFIVDTKKNLKINREKNIVKLVALKASGQTAEFEIQLNGKFMYRFDGYEGLACNKDIDPFMDDLKKIYDINVLHQDVQWSNPDKLATQKYQYINKNKGTN